MWTAPITSDGSSPHTRGARRRRPPRRRRPGIIPAYAGSTRTNRTFHASNADHPRIRGEHDASLAGQDEQEGSSPHTRGARHPRPTILIVRRIIPAYAGSTAWPWSWPGPWPDHPRIRGEHVQPTTREGIGQGSSPHTRGAQSPRVLHRGDRRIIPAYAGSTSKSMGMSCSIGWIIPAYAGSTRQVIAYKRPAADHPRIRGEHADDERRAVGGQRIIPAYAGSAGRLVGCGLTVTDHPRIRGEHVAVAAAGGVDGGSSPHTRGALGGGGGGPAGPGIIPAYAGSTDFSRSYSGFLRDHPRIRGEHPLDHDNLEQTEGSSPHTRGALQPAGAVAVAERIIPAYAGSTVKNGAFSTGMTGSSPHTRGAPIADGSFSNDNGIIPAYAGSTIS